MTTGTFSAGTVVEIDGRRHVLIRKIDADSWQLEDERTKRITELTVRDLHIAYAQRKLRFAEWVPGNSRSELAPVAADYPPEQWERAKIRRAYVMAIIDLPNTHRQIAPVIHETWLKLGQPANAPGTASAIRWKRRFLGAGRDITALMENNARKGNSTPRYPKEVEEFVEQAIDAKYLTRERGTIQDTIDMAIASVLRENAQRPAKLALPVPKRRLVKRMISKIPAFDRCEARHGRDAARERFRYVQSHRTTSAPLERGQIDHTDVDVFVIDDASRLPLGRPWVTACLDDYSRCTMGAYVGFEPPSYLSVARCLKQSILPKEELCERYSSIKNPWPVHGLMRGLDVDNGSELHSISLENTCLAMGIEIHYAPRRCAWFKGKIERFIGTFNRGLAHGTPGTTFANIFEKDDYDPSKQAVIRYSVFVELVYKWIVDVYHQKPHRTLGVPPVLMWTKSIAPDDIRLPPLDRLDAILGKSETRMLTHKGIELNDLLYNSPELTALRRRLGDRIEVEIRIDQTDIGAIMVIPPGRPEELIRAPALATDYASGLSEWQHKVIRRYAAKYSGHSGPLGWIEAKQEIAERIDRELLHSKSKSHKRIARYRGVRPERSPVPVRSATDSGVAPTEPASPGQSEDSSQDAALAPAQCVYPLTDGPVRKYTAVIRDRAPGMARGQE
jgi:putative transposase